MLVELLNGISTMPITLAVHGKGNYATRYIRLVPIIELGEVLTKANKITLDGESIEYPMPVKQAEFKWHIIYGIEKHLPIERDLEMSEELMQFCIDFSARAMKDVWLKEFLNKLDLKKPIVTNYKGSTWVGFDQDCELKLRTEICVVVTSNNQMSLGLSDKKQKAMYEIVQAYFDWITNRFWKLLPRSL
jgi:hypothetical protein